MPDKILFLTLRTFSATGGIEKVCRIIGKALYEKTIESGGSFEVCSMYDKQTDADDNPYFPAENFRGFGVGKLSFIKEMVLAGTQKNVVILSHINLLMVGWLIKKLAPRTKLLLLAHGIEVWYPVNAATKLMLNICDEVLSVSNYTNSKISKVHGLPENKCKVLNNCVDPFLPVPYLHLKNERLLTKYGFGEEDKILMTLTRLSSKERYKGYDKVIEAMAALPVQQHSIKYLIAGIYDQQEKIYLEKLITKLGLQHRVVMPGFIREEELADHFELADIYIMPSRKEGFGIVFLEAMYYGLPVIAGNTDGSADALLNGRLGLLVNPESVEEIKNAIKKMLGTPAMYKPDSNLLMQHFSYEVYKKKLETILAVPAE